MRWSPVNIDSSLQIIDYITGRSEKFFHKGFKIRLGKLASSMVGIVHRRMAWVARDCPGFG